MYQLYFRQTEFLHRFCFRWVAVAIGELISCTVLGVALVKLIESNESLKKIFTEE